MKRFLLILILILLTLCIFAENTNKNTSKALRLECPALSDDTLYSVYVEWATDDYGITYAYEYNWWDRASRWVCWQLHAGNSIKRTFRYSRFIEDDSIRKGYRVVAKNFYMTGMNRGHICPAQDRLCSRDQCKQTFHLGTNIAPQYQNHNIGIWARFEDWITDSLNLDEFRDTIYLCKGGTIDDDHVTNYTKRSKLIISDYWFGALLVLKDGVYNAMAYLTQHVDSTFSESSLVDFVISVDSLESFTGLDFFCNLDDSIEAEVEATVDTTFWKLPA